MAKDGGAADPLRNPRFQEPSVWQLFRESLFGCGIAECDITVDVTFWENFFKHSSLSSCCKVSI